MNVSDIQRKILDDPDRAFAADAIGLRRIERCARHQNCGEADQRMKRGDKLRHRGHGDPPGDHRSDRPADGHAAGREADDIGL